MASSNEIGVPACGDDDIFLDLVRMCGVFEAKHWADVMGLECAKSYALFAALFGGVRKNYTT